MANTPKTGDQLASLSTVLETDILLIGRGSTLYQMYRSDFRRSMNTVTTVNTATYTVLSSDIMIHHTYSSTGASTVTLPTALLLSGKVIYLKDAGGLAGTNNITIDTQGAEKIDGADTYVMNSNYQAIKLYSNGTNWFLL